MQIEVKLAPKLKDVFVGEARYRVAHGGRGSSKSWGFARMAILCMLQEPYPFLFGRELQNSIKDSVHKLLSSQVEMMGLGAYFDIGESYFRCKPTGAYGIFKGLRTNAHEIKSLEGVKRAWIEEAQKVSKESLELLIPTIRMPDSELWFTYNDDEMEDAVHQLFVVNPAPPRSRVVKINWDDNPWFPKELDEERVHMMVNDPETYDHVWNGNCRKFMNGSIYGKQMFAMKEAGRICKVPYNPSFPVFTAWDLGYADTTSIGFFQVVGKEPRIIDYYENHLEAIDHYVKLINAKSYNYDTHVLPHDAGHQSLRTGTTLTKQLESMGLKNVITLPQDAIASGIELVRQLLPQLWIDEGCVKLTKALSFYQYEWDEDFKRFKDRPIHDFASHPSDMVRYAATYLARRKGIVVAPQVKTYSRYQAGEWMA